MLDKLLPGIKLFHYLLDMLLIVVDTCTQYVPVSPHRWGLPRELWTSSGEAAHSGHFDRITLKQCNAPHYFGGCAAY